MPRPPAPMSISVLRPQRSMVYSATKVKSTLAIPVMTILMNIPSTSKPAPTKISCA